uniref:Polycystin cation channel PKD1/PKD2 domain-containing protein n=1 Tax=Guillardia theta TaxID=55529 RepID=A0A7S4KQD1_GUITH
MNNFDSRTNLMQGLGDGEYQRVATSANDDGEAPGSIRRATSAARNIRDQLEIGREELMEYLSRSKRTRESCIRIPLVVLLTITFFSSVMFHVDVARVCEVERAVEHIYLFSDRKDLSISHFQDIHSLGEFWDWMEHVFVPTTFVQTDHVGNQLSQADWGRISQYNRILGSVRLQQRRSRPATCAIHVLDAFYGSECHPKDREPDNQPYGTPLCPPYENVPAKHEDGMQCLDASGYQEAIGLHDATSAAEGFTNDTEDGVYRFWLSDKLAAKLVAERVRYLEARHWIDRQTDMVEIVVSLYNGELSVFTEAILKLNVERGGYIGTEFSIASILLDPYKVSGYATLSDAGWYVVLAIYSILTISTLPGVLKGRWPTFWELLSLASMIISYVLSFWWHLGLLQETREITSKVAEGMLLHEVEVQDRISQVTSDLQSYRIVCSLNLFFFLLQFLDVIRVQPRLAVILDTFAAASTDIFHFVLVFMTIVFCFAGMGTLLFGHELKAFSSISNSIVTCFELLVADMSAWQEMKALDQQTVTIGFTWVAGYVCLVTLIILNMLLAIVMDTYNARHGMAKEGEKDWSKEVFHSFNDVVQRFARRPTIYDVARAFEEKAKNADVITPDLLASSAEEAEPKEDEQKEVQGLPRSGSRSSQSSSISKDLAERCIQRVVNYQRLRRASRSEEIP